MTPISESRSGLVTLLLPGWLAYRQVTACLNFSIFNRPKKLKLHTVYLGISGQKTIKGSTAWAGRTGKHKQRVFPSRLHLLWGQQQALLRK